jgi:integration host factor subunit beta
MNKLDLVKKIHAENNITKDEARALVDVFFDQIANALATGDRVEIRGFCSFHVKTHDAYAGRNPKTGETITVKPKKLPFFQAGKELRRRVDY